jgi:5'-nucleotidase
VHKILVTNDDGVTAPGIQALAAAMRSLGNVEVVGPASNQSACGHRRTVFQDILVEDVTLGDGTIAKSVAGSPGDCIALSALGVATWPPDIVVSGINRGQNMGQDITYSGTVSAAFEAAIQGIPAVAVSLAQHDANTVEEYAVAAQIAARVVAQVLKRGLPPMSILNLNVPAVAHVKGIRLTRQGASIYSDGVERTGNNYRVLWLSTDGVMGKTDEEGTDLWAVHNGYASLTPLHLDLTAHRFLADLAAWDITVTDVSPQDRDFDRETALQS